jgi:hypothetical protein
LNAWSGIADFCYRLSRTIGTAPAEKPARFRQNAKAAGFAGRQALLDPCVGSAAIGRLRMAKPVFGIAGLFEALAGAVNTARRPGRPS